MMAVIGGVMPVGPMLLISLVRRMVVLVASSVCVLGFGFLERPGVMLSVMAACAAVMVVFVGTSSGGWELCHTVYLFIWILTEALEYIWIIGMKRNVRIWSKTFL